MIEQNWPYDAPEDPPYELPDDLDWPDVPLLTAAEYLASVVGRYLDPSRKGAPPYIIYTGTDIHRHPDGKYGYHDPGDAKVDASDYIDYGVPKESTVWSATGADPIGDIMAFREKAFAEWGYGKPSHVHMHVDSRLGEDLLCLGEHPKMKTLKNGREMPIVKRGTGPRSDPFKKGGKGRYDRKSSGYSW